MTEDELDSYREKLISRREELHRIRQDSAMARKPVELDQSAVGRLSRIDAMQAQAMSLDADRRRQVELARISGALGRLDEGTFGECASCGEDIERRRLDHDASMPLCLECARGAGRGG